MVNETALVDPERPRGKLKKFDRFLRTLTSRAGRTVWPITPSDEVIWPSRGGGRPPVTGFWAAQDLYQIANRSLDAYRKETPVRFDASATVRAPDAMHWTSTVPLYARDVPNIYTIHDLIPLRLPHTTTDDKATYMALCQGIANGPITSPSCLKRPGRMSFACSACPRIVSPIPIRPSVCPPSLRPGHRPT